ncbi:hypothetical protein MKZ01_06815 [Lysinibacillus endophyticus]|uniref:hypothetical protein n=1 Tax=Ureibacillus endophyticus TaxID=1978490 RepID=UPI00313659DF
MKKEKQMTVKKNKGLKLNFVASKVAQGLVAVGGMATVQACTAFFNEKKVPDELLKNNRFADNE